LDALEVSPRISREEAKNRFPQCGQYPLITSSDAHTLNDIGKSSTGFLMREASIKELKLALEGSQGRKVII
jgi:PHP family Zn ribbon phosphoesterase